MNEVNFRIHLSCASCVIDFIILKLTTMNFSILELSITGLILAILIYLYQRKEYKAKKKVFDNLSTSSTYEQITPIKKELAKSFYTRYAASKLTAYGVLFLTIVIILFGAYFFFNASTIARAIPLRHPYLLVLRNGYK